MTQCFDDQDEADEGDEHQIELVEAAEDSAKAFESSEEPLDLIAPSIQFLLESPGLHALGIGWHDGDEAQIQCELASLIAFIRAVHE